ncbi:MAG: MBL fold metallo-hydrolase [Oscillospiraceae bacterium]|nr:MBL fold metallo-hydrolase [Oscillospiraceae bacterium]
MEQIGRRVWYLPEQEATDRPNLGYIRGTRYALMVDAGNSPAHAALFLSGLAERGLPGPDFAAVTHWHWDHTYGLCALPCPVIAGRETAEQLEKMSRWQFDLPSMERRLAAGEEVLFCHENILKEYPDPASVRVRRADIVFDGALELELGDCPCRLLRVAGPHSMDSVAVYLPQDKIIFLGDSTAEEFYEGPAHYDPRRLKDYIALLEGLDFETAVPGHSEPEPKASIMEYLREELCAAEGHSL